VLVRFPFSDLSRAKLRPAIVLAHAGRGDSVLCQVTSRSYDDASAVAIGETDLATGALRVASFARPGKLFTANETIMLSTVATLKRDVLTRVIEAVVEILRSDVASGQRPARDEDASPADPHRDGKVDAKETE
jgi:mRNA interferase MazF